MEIQPLCLKHSEQLAHIETDLVAIKNLLIEIERKIDTTVVTRIEFEPLKRIVYGFVALIPTGFAVVLISGSWK